jgi:hypothetical protein
VRRRAYALRRKLEQVYAGELAAAKIRIDVPKGSYLPTFSRNLVARATRPDRVESLAAGVEHAAR